MDTVEIEPYQQSTWRLPAT